MSKPLQTLGTVLGISFLGSSIALTAPVAPPTVQSGSTQAQAPIHAVVKCATPGAEIHVTLDGNEPSQEDTEIDSGETVVVDHPLTLRAKAWLPDGSVSETVAVAYTPRPSKGNQASFDDQSIPSFMAAGQKARVVISLRNVGETTWTPESYALAPRKVKDVQTWSVVRAGLQAPVPTWKVAEFEFDVTAPEKPGTYNFDWRMQGPDGAAFGESAQMKRVSVVTPAEYQQLVSRFVGEQAGTTASGTAASSTSGKTKGAKREAQPVPLPQGVAPGSELARLYQELNRSPRSFKYLRTIGFNHSDAEFQMIVDRNGAYFSSTRIVRRDEAGKRVIPGWPGVKLKKK